MGIICACLPVCWPVILKLSNISALSRLRTRGGSGSSGSGRKWWHGHRQSESWSAPPTSRQSHLGSREDRRNKRAGHQETELLRTSDVELPILSAPVLEATDDGNNMYRPPLYSQQVRIWSDGRLAEIPEPQGGIHIDHDQTFHMYRRPEYPV